MPLEPEEQTLACASACVTEGHRTARGGPCLCLSGRRPREVCRHSERPPEVLTSEGICSASVLLVVSFLTCALGQVPLLRLGCARAARAGAPLWPAWPTLKPVPIHVHPAAFSSHSPCLSQHFGLF